MVRCKLGSCVSFVLSVLASSIVSTEEIVMIVQCLLVHIGFLLLWKMGGAQIWGGCRFFGVAVFNFHDHYCL